MASPRQREILLHALTGGKHKVYRHHFVTGPGSKDFDDCMEMSRIGWMTKRGPIERMAGDYIFHVTEEGAAQVGKPLPE